jgi:nicotinamidase-related amidase
MNKRAIIIVDLQKDYLATGKFPLAGIDKAIANAAAVLAAARLAQDLVIHVRHEGTVDAPFFGMGTEGAEIVPAMAPANGETVITKARPNAFHGTELQTVLTSAGIESVVIVGAMSHMCIDATARAAVDFGFKTTVIADACATRDLAFGDETVPSSMVHTAFMAALAFAYAEVVTTEQFATASSVSR